MRYDDDRYYSDEEDNDLWDDELELNSDDYRPEPSGMSPQPYVPDTSSYSPYDTEEDPHHPDGYEAPDHADDGRYEDEANHDDEPDDYYSDPEPKETNRSRCRGFFEEKDDYEEEGNDYFDSDSDSDREAPPAAKTPKPPRLDPEDPDYWADEEEDSPLSDIIRPPKKKWIWKLLVVIGVMLALTGGWIWLFRPYADNAVKYGYILNMERRGSIFKTFEGTMIPYKELGDPDPFYFKEQPFSVASDSLAAVMKRMMLGCVPVRVEYETFHTALPWKGEQTMIIIKADTADPRKILPPEFRYNDK